MNKIEPSALTEAAEHKHTAIALELGSQLIDANHDLFMAKQRIAKLEGFADWTLRVATTCFPSEASHSMALSRISDEARKVLDT